MRDRARRGVKITPFRNLQTNSPQRESSAGQIGKKNPRQKTLETELRGIYEVLAPGSDTNKVSPTTSTILEPGKTIVTLKKSDIAKFGTLQEKQTPVRVYADRQGPRRAEKMIDEQIQSHIKEFTRKLKGDKKIKNRRREPCNGDSSSRSNILRAMRGRIPKVPNFPALRNQHNTDVVDLQSKFVLPQLLASLSELQQFEPAAPTTQSKHPSDRNRRSPAYYRFENSLSDSTIAAP